MVAPFHKLWQQDHVRRITKSITEPDLWLSGCWSLTANSNRANSGGKKRRGGIKERALVSRLCFDKSLPIFPKCWRSLCVYLLRFPFSGALTKNNATFIQVYSFPDFSEEQWTVNHLVIVSSSTLFSVFHVSQNTMYPHLRSGQFPSFSLFKARTEVLSYFQVNQWSNLTSATLSCPFPFHRVLIKEETRTPKHGGI